MAQARIAVLDRRSKRKRAGYQHTSGPLATAIFHLFASADPYCGPGATVTAFLPSFIDLGTASCKNEQARAMTDKLTNSSILLLDSDPLTRTILHETLEHAGYLVVAVDDLGAAV